MSEDEFPHIMEILGKIANKEKLTRAERAEYERYKNRIIENYKYRRRNPH